MEPTSSRSRTRPHSLVGVSSSLEQGTNVYRRRPRNGADALHDDTIKSEDLEIVETSAPAIPPPLPSQMTRAARAGGKSPVKRPRDQAPSLRPNGQRPLAEPIPLVRLRGPSIPPAPEALPAASLAAPWTPVNVWDFEYPWLEYRQPPYWLLACLLLVSVFCAANAYRAELHGYWVESWPQLHAALTEEVQAVWMQCRALWAHASALFL